MNTRNLIKICAIVCGISGIIVLIWVFYPIISYELKAPALMTFLSPVPPNGNNQASSSGSDYTKASTWFPTGANEQIFTKGVVSHYKLSIPKLGIKNASVAIGGEDLSQSLIQYPGTALPGQIGNAVIFGHSVLPSFFDPKDYLTIFSTLPTLGSGDVITLSYNGITYKYQVEQKYEVEPTDVQILSQDESDSFISLVTCVPPGLQTRRLIVKARIVPITGS